MIVIDINNIPGFIEAKEANKKAKENSVIANNINEILTDIFNKINVAIFEGKFCVEYSIHYNYKNTIIIFLQGYDYKVTEKKTNHNEWLLTISWIKEY